MPALPPGAAAPLAPHVAALAGGGAREAHGTFAELRRALAAAPHANSTLEAAYARAYRAALAESSMLFAHLSKSGGTGLCELAKVNGCSRAAAGESTFNGNCADKHRMDGPWWLPPSTVQRIRPAGLQHFAMTNFQVPPSAPRFMHGCGFRGRRRAGAAAGGWRKAWLRELKPPTFFAVEGALPEEKRCAGTLELLLLREPLSRLGSFGRELNRWGLLPKPESDCDALLGTQEAAGGGKEVSRKERQRRRAACDALKDAVCSNYSVMAAYATPVYDNQLTRTLLGAAVYGLPYGAITQQHYQRAAERLRGIDVLLRLGESLNADLAARLGWRVQRLDTSYRRASQPDGSAAASRPRAPCSLVGPSADAARRANKWDLLLYEEALRLEASDRAFFGRSHVAAELAPPPPPAGRSATAAASSVGAGSVGAASRCGLLAEPSPAPPRRGAAAVLGAAPACHYRTWRHTCCWRVGAPALERGRPGRSVSAPMPKLPLPIACVLPPGGYLSEQPSVRLPPVSARQHHASCALACADFEHFALEGAGTFCHCLDAAELAASTGLSVHECRPACSHSSRIILPAPGQSGPNAALPCGGAEALAVFDTAAVMAALAEAAAAAATAPAAAPPTVTRGPGRRLGSASPRLSGRATGRGFAAVLSAIASNRSSARRHGRPRAPQEKRAQEKRAAQAEACVEMAAACPSGEQVGPTATRALYVHARGKPRRLAGGWASGHVLLGCFDEVALQKHGLLASRPMYPPSARVDSADDEAALVLRCSLGCSRHMYFVVGSAKHVGGPCVCGDAPTVTWRRNAQGLPGLQRQQLRAG